MDFIHLAFEDSTIEPAQKALSDGNLSVFDTYETEYSLIHDPVFSWDQDEAKSIEPNQNLTVTLQCFGKVGWYALTQRLEVIADIYVALMEQFTYHTPTLKTLILKILMYSTSVKYLTH